MSVSLKLYKMTDILWHFEFCHSQGYKFCLISLGFVKQLYEATVSIISLILLVHLLHIF
jgi:hypothetical protein